MILYTIGYEGIDIDFFVSLLTKNRINAIADVRMYPVSRKKGFSKKALIEILNKNNIVYHGFKSLGTTKVMRDELYKTGDFDSFFQEYRSFLHQKEDDLFDLYNKMDDNSRMALLCFERHASECHRKIVAEEIKKIDGNGLKIKHIEPFT